MYTGLADALRAVLGVKNARHLGHEWDIVYRALLRQARLQRIGQIADDVAQMASYRIMRAGKAFDGAVDAEAARFLWRIVRRAHLDMVDTTRRRDPMDRLWQPSGDDDRDTVDRFAAPDFDPTTSADAEAAFEETIDRLRGHVDLVIEAENLPQARRVLARLQVEATVLAVLREQGAREIARALGVEKSDDAIYKWTERGREWIARALDRWERETDGDEIDAVVIAELRAQLLKRRKDAGRARPQRRHKEKPKR